MRKKLKKLRIAARIWRLFIFDCICGGRSKKIVEKLKAAYMDYYLFLKNTADVGTEEGKQQVWRARALIEELTIEGENLWRKG